MAAMSLITGVEHAATMRAASSKIRFMSRSQTVRQIINQDRGDEALRLAVPGLPQIDAVFLQGDQDQRHQHPRRQRLVGANAPAIAVLIAHRVHPLLRSTYIVACMIMQMLFAKMLLQKA